MNAPASRPLAPFSRLLARRIAFAAAVLILAAVVVWYALSAGAYRRGVEQRLGEVARLTAAQIDAATHAQLVDAEDEATARYLGIRSTLRLVLQTGAPVHRAFTLRQANDGRLTVVVDAAIDPQTAAPLGRTYYAASETLTDNFGDFTEPLIEEEIRRDAQDTSLWAYVPFYRADGTREGVLAVNIVTNELAEYERQLRLLALITLLCTVVPLAGLGWWSGWEFTRPVHAVVAGMEKLSGGDLKHRIDLERHDEAGVLIRTFNALPSRFYTMLTEMEQQVNLHNRTAQQRGRYLEFATDLAEIVSTETDTERLIQTIIELIARRFQLYYTGLFLVDEAREWAVLRAGTGKAGEAMLRRGHRLRLDDTSMIGWSITQGQNRIAQDASMDTVRQTQDELPDTRSEAALPLRARGKVLGALSAQSTRMGAFDRDTLLALQAAADQLALALEAASLARQHEEAQQAVRQAYGELSRRAWNDLLRARRNLGYAIDERGILPLSKETPEYPLTDDLAGLPEVSFPIQVRGQVLGRLEARKPNLEEWTEEERLLLETLVEQLGVALESARLYQETQRRAERERLAGEITARLRASNDPQVILQTAVTELRQALQAAQAQVLFQAAEDGSPEGPAPEGNQ